MARANGRGWGYRVVGVLAGSFFGVLPAAAQGGVESFCDPAASGIVLGARGSALLEANEGHGNLELVAENAPAPYGWFLMGDLQLQHPPFGSQAGSLCVAGTRGLISVLSEDAEQQVGEGAGGWMLRHTLDYLEGDAMGAAVQVGSTWNYQFVHRAGRELAASNGLEITFGPPVVLTGWKTVAAGTWSDHPEAAQRGVLVIDDAQEWGEYWLLHTGGSYPGLGTPVASFEHESVLVVYAGEQVSSGYAIEIVELALSVTTLDLRTMSTAPGVGCGILPVITQPYHIVTVPKIEGLQIGDWQDTVRGGDPCQ